MIRPPQAQVQVGQGPVQTQRRPESLPSVVRADPDSTREGARIRVINQDREVMRDSQGPAVECLRSELEKAKLASRRRPINVEVDECREYLLHDTTRRKQQKTLGEIRSLPPPQLRRWGIEDLHRNEGLGAARPGPRGSNRPVGRNPVAGTLTSSSVRNCVPVVTAGRGGSCRRGAEYVSRSSALVLVAVVSPRGGPCERCCTVAKTVRSESCSCRQC